MKFSAFLVLLAAGLVAARAGETLRPEQLQAGMKGYGLSVFRGTEPARFAAEVLGVLPNVFPKQDMILIRLSGADLEKHKVIAGMSGSPIYIEGKLIGALAYGWTFENEPLAGVTPIQNMLATLSRPAAPAPRGNVSSLSSPFPSSFFPLPSSSSEAPRPLLTPLCLGGFGPRTLALVSEQFAGWGMLPVAAGGPANGGRPLPRGRIAPGGALGVQLIRGDLNATAVGTATYVEGNKVLAFGHPFFAGGQFTAPAVAAQVHTIMSSLQSSFKMASAVASVGAMIGDWQSGIVADTAVVAPMIPLTVAVANQATGQHEQYHLEVIDNEVFSPLLVQAAVAQAIEAASGSSQDTTVQVGLTAELAPMPGETAGRTIRLANTFFNPSGGLVNPATWAPLKEVFDTPFGHTTVKRIAVTVAATQTRQTAIIKGAYFARAEAERGASIPLKVVVQPFGKPELTITVPIATPAATASLQYLAVNVLAGGDAPADVARPESIANFLDALQKRHRTTDLVVLVQSPGHGLQYRGQLLKDLPRSVANVLDNFNNVAISGIADIEQITVPTDWVLSGQAFTSVPIRPE